MKSFKGRIFIRADADNLNGFGHFFRCLALISMINDDFECHFIIRNPSNELVEKISKLCLTYFVLPEINDPIKEAKYLVDYCLENGSIVILDGYKFDTNYQRIIKEKAYRIISIDDIHPYHFISDAVINQIPINIDGYSTEDYTKLYLGFNYSLLREPFLSAAKFELFHETKQANVILICFGGSDYFNLTSFALKCILDIESIVEIHIIIGSGFLHSKELQSLSLSKPERNINIHMDLNAKEMVSVIKKCDTAIVSASSILLECIACGVSFVTGFYVDNQKEFVNFLNQKGLIDNYIDFKSIRIDEFRKIISEHNPHYQIPKIVQYRNQIKNAKQNVRIMINNTINSSNPLLLSFQREKFVFKSFSLLSEEEMKLILGWRNHESVRKWMFNKNLIKERDHLNFITHLHEKKDKAYWLVLINDKPLGVVNLINFDGESCEWGIYLRPDAIGSGIGIDVQYYYLNILFTEIKIKTLIAFVNIDNTENLHVQQLFDFNKENEAEIIDDIPYFKLTLDNERWIKLENDIKNFKIKRLLSRL